MLSIAPNPGLPLLAAGLLMLALPALARAPVLALGALGSLVMLFAPDFDASQAMEQLGVVIVVRFDALAQLIGFSLTLIALVATLGAPQPRSRGEDAALGLHLGAAATAVFAGDLVSLLAATELSALAGGWLILAAGGRTALAAGARYLMWQAPAAIALLAGCAFLLAHNNSSEFGLASLNSLGGVLLLIGFAIRIGAPLAHPWLRDAAAAVSPGALTAMVLTGPLLGLYALTRAFPGEPVLVVFGLGMIALGAIYAFAEADLRRAFGGLVTLQMGTCLAAAGAPEGLGAGAAALLAFTATVGSLALGAALAVGVSVAGATDARHMPALAPRLPLSAVSAVIGAASLGAAPVLAGGVGLGLAAGAHGAAGGAFGAFIGPIAAALGALAAARVAAATFFAPTGVAPKGPRVVGGGVLIALLLSVFLCIAIGAAPRWLTALAPNPLAIQIAWIDLIDLALAAAAALSVLGLACAIRITALRGVGAPLDVDDLYRGPVFALLRWLAALVLRLFSTLRALGEAGLAGLRRGFVGLARFADRPYRPAGPGLAGALAASLLLIFLVISSKA
jgi:multicomponent Na+:H+ antiporter subunit D